MWFTYTVEYYSASKKEKVMPFTATWMGLDSTVLSEMSEKQECHADLTYIASLKKYNRLVDIMKKAAGSQI